MDEKRLVERCLKNDASAQRQLYECFAPKMMVVCLRYAGNREYAHDMLQDGFIKVFEKLDAYNGKGSFEGWIRRIVVNTCIDIIRRDKKRLMDQDIDDVAYKLPESNRTDDSAQYDDLMAMVQALPDGYRTVFNLFAIEGYGHKEIGDMLGVSENTSKSQYSRARAMLRKMVEQESIDYLEREG